MSDSNDYQVTLDALVASMAMHQVMLETLVANMTECGLMAANDAAPIAHDAAPSV